jgi:hypothetical protein
VQGEWSGYTLQVLSRLRASAAFRAFHFYPYPEENAKELKIKNEELKIGFFEKRVLICSI